MLEKDHDNLYDDASIVREFRERYSYCRPSKLPPAGLPPDAVLVFRKIIYGYFKKFKRDFPWRHTDDPYHILVSEIMLQQTQVGRVAEKYPDFIKAFPTIEALAAAPLKDVLTTWQGMGYNRRARYLHELARRLKETEDGSIPDSPEELVRLPGIGRATAASISAFAFNRPVVFIETNIRAVFIHFFFHALKDVSDERIIPLVAAALDRKNARRWYSALMDYGTMLKKRHPNPSRRSAHHQVQPPFEGSRRQMRGLVLKKVLEHPRISTDRLAALLNKPEGTVASILDDLVREGMIQKKGGIYSI